MIDIRIRFSHIHNKDEFYYVWHHSYQLGTLTNQLADGWRFLPSASALPALRYLHYDSLTEALEKLPSHLSTWLSEYAVHVLQESLVTDD